MSQTAAAFDFSSATVEEIMILRDGGTIRVLLSDANAQQCWCRFDYSIGSKTRGRLYLPGRFWTGSEKSQLVPLNDELHHAVLDALARHLNLNYTEEEQEALAALDGNGGFHSISKRDYEGYLLIYCASQLQKLAQG